MVTKKYGVVYTPHKLAEFAAELLYTAAKESEIEIKTILDPACGECALLKASKEFFDDDVLYYGIDIDEDVIKSSGDDCEIILNDAIMPENSKISTAEYWRRKLKNISAIIANPPWSTEKLYSREMLQNAGFTLTAGQYDSFVLFLELAYKILDEGGLFSFIIPDSLFDAQNEKLRRFLTENMEILVIARLGEKIFAEVNRATTVIVCRKTIPSADSITKCFRLTTDDRKKFLTTEVPLSFFYNKCSHEVFQRRFADNAACNFDIDTHAAEESILSKIQRNTIDWNENFTFGRGVEISKTGKIVVCPLCGFAQGYKKSQMANGEKICTNCGNTIPVKEASTQNVISKVNTPHSVQIFVGENIRRYRITGECYIKLDIPGINYKNREMYEPPKLLVRKTGLGIYASIDYTGSMTSQTVYILKLKDHKRNVPLEYYLGLLNSRVVYYFYLKVYGENEWKSHPYLTKQIIFSLPIKRYEGTLLDKEIIKLASYLANEYNHDMDLELENLIFQKYDLTAGEIRTIYMEMNRLPDLSAINDMKN